MLFQRAVWACRLVCPSNARLKNCSIQQTKQVLNFNHYPPPEDDAGCEGGTGGASVTGVGAILLLFSLPSSVESDPSTSRFTPAATLAVSDALLSRLTPGTTMPGTLLVEPLTECPGVCGGVKRGTPPGFEFEPIHMSQ